MKKTNGFSLLEMLIALGLFAILSGLAVISFRHYHERALQQKAIIKLHTTINYAITIAKTYKQPVWLCPGTIQTGCQKGPWRQGWLIYTKTENNPAQLLRRVSDIEPLLLKKNSTPYRFSVSQYGRPQNTTFSLCHPDNNRPIAKIVILYSGRVRIDEENIDC